MVVYVSHVKSRFFFFLFQFIFSPEVILRFFFCLCLLFVCGGGCVGGVGFWLQSGICFGFYPINWGHTAKRGYPQFLVRAVYSITALITGAIECVKAPHLVKGGNVTSCPVKSLNSMIIYRSTGVNWGH